MAYSNKGTPLMKTKAEDENSEEQLGIPTFENFKCEIHPPFKIEALNVNTTTNSIFLHCIKCIIDGDCFKQADEYKLVTIKELLETCSDTIIRQKKDSRRSKTGLRDKFVGFLTKEYASAHEKYLASQYQSIDQEINPMIDKLNLVREKYKEHYFKEIETVRLQEVEVKEKINRLIQGDMEMEVENKTFTSLDEIYEHLNKITTTEELSTFLGELYQESKERVQDVTTTDEVKHVLSTMENIKEKAECTKSKGIAEIASFRDFRQTLDNLLQDGSKSFKKSIDTVKSPKFDFEPMNNLKALDPNNMFLPIPEHDEALMSPYTASPVVKDMGSTAKKQRDMNNQDTVKKRRKNFKETDINSQSLKKLKKICESSDQEGSMSKKEKLISSLNDWINRRITGYLIFQNSMNGEGSKRPGISDTGVHLNHATGSKWKTMSEKEKEEYKNLAKEYRKIFKREVEECDNLENTNDIIEEFDEKIKKIKLF